MKRKCASCRGPGAKPREKVKELPSKPGELAPVIHLWLCDSCEAGRHPHPSQTPEAQGQ